MITSLYAGILGLLFLTMSIKTIGARRKHQVSLGPGPNNEIIHFVSAHDNFKAYAPLLLLLTFILEATQSISPVLIHLLACLFTIGRFLHYFGFKGEKMDFKKRVIGMHLTLWPLMLLAIANIFVFIKVNFL